MRPFQTLEGIAAPLPMADIDTDKILPARFLTTITRVGLGSALFSSLRSAPEFVLNRPPWTEASILVTLANFGCGSSREHAPWALLDFGTRCIIAPSFADIFYNNCFKNGILPVILPAEVIDHLLELVGTSSTARLRIDLAAQTVADATGAIYRFEVDAKRKHDLWNGVDEIARTLGMESEISAFEKKCAMPGGGALTRSTRDINSLIK